MVHYSIRKFPSHHPQPDQPNQLAPLEILSLTSGVYLWVISSLPIFGIFVGYVLAGPHPSSYFSTNGLGKPWPAADGTLLAGVVACLEVRVDPDSFLLGVHRVWD